MPNWAHSNGDALWTENKCGLESLVQSYEPRRSQPFATMTWHLSSYKGGSLHDYSQSLLQPRTTANYLQECPCVGRLRLRPTLHRTYFGSITNRVGSPVFRLKAHPVFSPGSWAWEKNTCGLCGLQGHPSHSKGILWFCWCWCNLTGRIADESSNPRLMSLG